MQISQLVRYPLKSSKGENLERAELDALGIKGDRRLILCEPDGRFVTARSEPELLQLEVQPELDGWRASHPSLGSTYINQESSLNGEVEVWGRRITAPRLAGSEHWFSQLLGRKVKVLWNREAADLADKRYPWGPIFSDGYPLLVCNTASLAAINQATGGMFEMSRFRPNLVIDTALPWAEDEWELLQIGEVLLRRRKPCERCMLITRDPQTGDKDPNQEPLRTLAKLHRGPNREVLFGQNFSVERAGQISVGDEVQLA